MDFEVTVIGAGTAGVVAAIQSARAGARTLLVEKNALPGGTTTSAEVAFPGLFHAWGKQVIAGIGWELVSQCVRETGQSLPDFETPGRPHYSYQVRIDPFVYGPLCCEALSLAGCKLLFHTMIANAEQDSDFWNIQLCTKTGLKTIKTAVLIDCTGDANAAAMAGAELRRVDNPQPATLMCQASGYDFDGLDIETINRNFEIEVRAGNLSYTDASWNTEAANVGTWLSKHGQNANHLKAANAQTSEGRTALELRAQKSLLRLCRFLKTQKGLEGLRLDHVARETGVRETVTVIGEECITADDYVSGRLWKNAVCNAFYPIDLHGDQGSGLDCRQLQEGTVPSVPLGALIPRGCQNLIVGGRCISSDRLANSALRVQATCMATGQVAGALGALSASTNADPWKVDLNSLRRLLTDHGAIVPDWPA
jgi:FAD dependent oxidoreductase